MYQYNPEPLVLLKAIKEGIILVTNSAKDKRVDIELNVEAGIEIFSDLNMFQTTIRNIVSNAVKFTPAGGKVTISAIQKMPEIVEISVKDTGVGMDNTILENLFRLGTNIKRSGTEGEPSSGLGLLLCKDLVEKLGGEIWVDSKEGKGTTFNFTVKSSKPNPK
jgi:signal transduction histidine kinase